MFSSSFCVNRIFGWKFYERVERTLNLNFMSVYLKSSSYSSSPLSHCVCVCVEIKLKGRPLRLWLNQLFHTRTSCIRIGRFYTEKCVKNSIFVNMTFFFRLFIGERSDRCATGEKRKRRGRSPHRIDQVRLRRGGRF